jgi:hypothetical protein
MLEAKMLVVHGHRNTRPAVERPALDEKLGRLRARKIERAERRRDVDIAQRETDVVPRAKRDAGLIAGLAFC